MPRREDVAIAVAAGAIVVVANRAGVGWSWDSTDYVETGINLAEGRGLVDVTGRLMTVRPPGLPAVVAVGHVLGIAPSATLQVLNASCAVAVTLLAALLLRAAAVGDGARRWGLAMVAASPALLWQYTMAWSEPPFLVLELAACVVALRTWRPWRWPLLAALCAAMGFVRYVGPVFAAAVVAGGLMADLARRRAVGAVARSVALHAGTLAASAVPVGWWLARNRAIDGTWTGARAPGGGSILGPLRTATATLGTWVLGRPFEGGIYMAWADYPSAARLAGGSAVVVAGLGLTAAVVAALRARRTEPVTTLALLVVGSYVAFSAWRFVHVELGPLDNRMMIPVHVPLLVLAAVGADRIGRVARRRGPRSAAWALGALAAVGLALLAPQAATTARDAATFGREGRHWTSRSFQRAPIHAAARALDGPAGWYSNEPQQLYAAVRSGPILTQYQKDDGPLQRCDHYYVVWYRRTFLPDGEPTGLPVLHADDWGTIYDLGPCGENVNLRWP